MVSRKQDRKAGCLSRLDASDFACEVPKRAHRKTDRRRNRYHQLRIADFLSADLFLEFQQCAVGLFQHLRQQGHAILSLLRPEHAQQIDGCADRPEERSRLQVGFRRKSADGLQNLQPSRRRKDSVKHQSEWRWKHGRKHQHPFGGRNEWFCTR